MSEIIYRLEQLVIRPVVACSEGERFEHPRWFSVLVELLEVLEAAFVGKRDMSSDLSSLKTFPGLYHV